MARNDDYRAQGGETCFLDNADDHGNERMLIKRPVNQARLTSKLDAIAPITITGNYIVTR